MEDKRFHKKRVNTFKQNILQEQGMFTTLLVDDKTKIDMFVKFKRFTTKTDGNYSLVALVEVDIATKSITGRYILLKLQEYKTSKELLKLKQQEESK